PLSIRPRLGRFVCLGLSHFLRVFFPFLPVLPDPPGSPLFPYTPLFRSGLPHLLTGSASRTKFISRLNTQPARTPVNASPSPLRAEPQDTRPKSSHKPITYDAFSHYKLPVYPGARRSRDAHCSAPPPQFR